MSSKPGALLQKSSDTCCKHFSSKQVISSQHVCRQTISPRQSASYQAAVDDTSPVWGDSNLHCLNSSVSIHTTGQKSPSHKCVKVCVYTCIFVLCWAITEGVGLATVTNTSQPLESQRPRHLQCLLKTLRKNTTQKHPINFQNWRKNNEEGQRVITGWEALCKSEFVSSSTGTERQTSLTKLIFLLGVCSVAKWAVILSSTIITATEYLIASTGVATSQWPNVCVFMGKVRVRPLTRGLWMFIKRLIKDFSVFRSRRMYVKFACFSDSHYMKGDTRRVKPLQRCG